MFILKKKGYTLIELLLSIGIMLILSSGIFISYSYLKDKSNTDSTINDIVEVVTLSKSNTNLKTNNANNNYQALVGVCYKLKKDTANYSKFTMYGGGCSFSHSTSKMTWLIDSHLPNECEFVLTLSWKNGTKPAVSPDVLNKRLENFDFINYIKQSNDKLLLCIK